MLVLLFFIAAIFLYNGLLEVGVGLPNHDDAMNYLFVIALVVALYLNYYHWNYTIYNNHDRLIFVRGKNVHKEYLKSEYTFHGNEYRGHRLLLVFDRQTNKRKKMHSLELSRVEYRRLIRQLGG